MKHLKTTTAIVIAAIAALPAMAQQPGQITSGATGVTVNGKPAARVGDTVDGDGGGE